MKNLIQILFLILALLLFHVGCSDSGSEWKRLYLDLEEQYKNLDKDHRECLGQVSKLKKVKTFIQPKKLIPKKNESELAEDNLGEHRWIVNSMTSKIDDSKVVVLTKASKEKITGWHSEHWPSLIIRCSEKKLSAYITTGMPSNVEYGHDGATATIRFDKNKAFKKRMSKSTDNKALFFSRAKWFVGKMLKAKEMLFVFTPFNSSPTQIEFDLRGLDKVVGDLYSACKIRWKRKATKTKEKPVNLEEMAQKDIEKFSREEDKKDEEKKEPNKKEEAEKKLKEFDKYLD